MNLLENFIEQNPPLSHKYTPNDGPIVSVLMAVYKTQPKRLRMAIESILNQTFKNFELIIVNDYPDDTECESIIKSYNDTRIKYFKNDKNMGIAAARNKLLEIALDSPGKYILTVDHDDEQLPEKLEKLVAVLDANPDIGICGTWWYRVADDGTSVIKVPTYDAFIKMLFLLNLPTIPHSSLVRKDLLQKHNIRYDSKYDPMADAYLILDIIKHTRACNVPQPLMRYHWYTQNTSNRERARYEQLARQWLKYLKTNFPNEFQESATICEIFAQYDSEKPNLRKKYKKYKNCFNVAAIIIAILLCINILLLVI